MIEHASLEKNNSHNVTNDVVDVSPKSLTHKLSRCLVSHSISRILLNESETSYVYMRTYTSQTIKIRSIKIK